MYKKLKVTMLSSNNSSLLYKDYSSNLAGTLYCINTLVPKSEFYKPQHLYIVSDDEIKEGDWFILKDNHPHGRLRKCHYISDKQLMIDAKTDIGWGFSYQEEAMKIIATTDFSLTIKSQVCRFHRYLPEIPQDFIKLYCEKGGIDEIEVEYIHLGGTGSGYKLKINSDNTINIKTIKDSYTREEVIELCSKALRDYTATEHCISKWINKNI